MSETMSNNTRYLDKFSSFFDSEVDWRMEEVEMETEN